MLTRNISKHKPILIKLFNLDLKRTHQILCISIAVIGMLHINWLPITNIWKVIKMMTFGNATSYIYSVPFDVNLVKVAYIGFHKMWMNLLFNLYIKKIYNGIKPVFNNRVFITTKI